MKETYKCCKCGTKTNYENGQAIKCISCNSQLAVKVENDSSAPDTIEQFSNCDNLMGSIKILKY